jgi:catechol 2,3-dioxygenase-like lactoylglutathione lyase family enzyme
VNRPAALALSCVLAGAVGASAQIRSLNGAGIAAAHEHLLVTDEAASTAFWSALGGMPDHVGTIAGVKFPGVYVLFQTNRGRAARGGAGQPQAVPPAAPATPAPPADGSVGSVAEALGFKVKDLRAILARLEALGIKPDAGATTKTASVMSPENVRVLLTEDATLATQVASSELLMKVPDPAAAAAWYAKWFGAEIGRQGQDVIAEIPGMNMRFVQVAQAAAGTRGRALDHIGFEVANLQAFAQKLQEGGVTINRPYGNMSLGFLTAITFITDPWGTYIELNEGYVNGPK